MEVALPLKPIDSHFNSFTFGGAHYSSSAPTSPNRFTELYCGFDELLISADKHRKSSPATIPFAWEDKPGVPKSYCNSFQDDFAFDVSCSDFGSDSVWAEDLFDGGVIKTLGPQQEKKKERERGRERVSSSSSSGLHSSRSRRTRSMSPIGSSYYRQQQQSMAINTKDLPASTCSSPCASSSEKGSRKWSFKDLFLFRSASDGRAMDRDPLKKYSTFFSKLDTDFKNRNGSGLVLKRRERVSAHELHYTMNRAVSNDMKRKTYLPYKQGILGRFAFNP